MTEVNTATVNLTREGSVWVAVLRWGDTALASQGPNIRAALENVAEAAALSQWFEALCKHYDEK